MKQKQFSWNFNIKKKYSIIYADPPWKYTTKVSYPTVPIKDIQEFPIGQIKDENCALFLWAPYAILPECIETLKVWG